MRTTALEWKSGGFCFAMIVRENVRVVVGCEMDCGRLGWGSLRQGIRERTRVEPRESFGLGRNEDSRPSKGVLFPYFLAFVMCRLQLKYYVLNLNQNLYSNQIHFHIYIHIRIRTHIRTRI